jgi:hypothetical protein
VLQGKNLKCLKEKECSKEFPVKGILREKIFWKRKQGVSRIQGIFGGEASVAKERGAEGSGCLKGKAEAKEDFAV